MSELRDAPQRAEAALAAWLDGKVAWATDFTQKYERLLITRDADLRAATHTATKIARAEAATVHAAHTAALAEKDAALAALRDTLHAKTAALHEQTSTAASHLRSSLAALQEEHQRALQALTDDHARTRVGLEDDFARLHEEVAASKRALQDANDAQQTDRDAHIVALADAQASAREHEQRRRELEQQVRRHVVAEQGYAASKTRAMAQLEQINRERDVAIEDRDTLRKEIVVLRDQLAQATSNLPLSEPPTAAGEWKGAHDEVTAGGTNQERRAVLRDMRDKREAEQITPLVLTPETMPKAKPKAKAKAKAKPKAHGKAHDQGGVAPARGRRSRVVVVVEDQSGVPPVPPPPETATTTRRRKLSLVRQPPTRTTNNPDPSPDVLGVPTVEQDDDNDDDDNDNDDDDDDSRFHFLRRARERYPASRTTTRALPPHPTQLLRTQGLKPKSKRARLRQPSPDTDTDSDADAEPDPVPGPSKIRKTWKAPPALWANFVGLGGDSANASSPAHGLFPNLPQDLFH